VVVYNLQSVHSKKRSLKQLLIQLKLRFLYYSLHDCKWASLFLYCIILNLFFSRTYSSFKKMAKLERRKCQIPLAWNAIEDDADTSLVLASTDHA
jgi:hypothetical protein